MEKLQVHRHVQSSSSYQGLSRSHFYDVNFCSIFQSRYVQPSKDTSKGMFVGLKLSGIQQKTDWVVWVLSSSFEKLICNSYT